MAKWGPVLEWVLLRCVRRMAWVGFDADDPPAPHAERTATFAPDLAALAGRFDAVCVLLGPGEDLADALEAALPHLHPYGAVFPVTGPDCDLPLVTHAALRYIAWIVLHDRLFCVDPAEAPPDAPRVGMYVRHDYDPVRHARHLYRLGNPGWAIEVLENVPEHVCATAEARADLAAQRMLCMLSADAALDPAGRLNRFARAQDDFFKGTTWVARHPLAWRARAKFWLRLGAPDMARRTLRTIHHVEPAEDTQAELEALAGAAPPEHVEERVPQIETVRRPLRLLYLTHAKSDYGADVLYDGLCRMLGPENVIEFPPKPFYHGVNAETLAARYPCVFDHPAHGLELEEVIRQLQERRFDCVVHCDVLNMIETELVRRLLHAACDTPLVLLDTWDNCGNYRADTLAHLGRGDCLAYFKREMLIGQDYGPRSFPLPFAYPDHLAPENPPPPQSSHVFWAGKPLAGGRRIVLERLHERFGLEYLDDLSQEDYRARILSANIGLCLFGNGYDTVRYWEIVAHGRLLLAERPPIRIPYNFRDGIEAIFFDDLPDLEDKWQYWLAHPELSAHIAAAGHARFRQHHTGSARAAQFIARLEALLDGGAAE